MKLLYCALIAIALAGGLSGCEAYVSRSTPAPIAGHHTKADATPDAQAETPVTIGTLEARDHTIHMYAGKFTIKGADGQVLINLADYKDFAGLLPQSPGRYLREFRPWPFIADNGTGTGTASYSVQFESDLIPQAVFTPMEVTPLP